ncbi:hypothetical protein GDR29_05845 [Xanthomonas oryzae pv. oryzae]|nr:hypothetical protein GDR29_05845 [Xanthomonas oryzae pv. oryzae]
MKVRIKDLSVTMELGNNGVIFDVYGNDETFLGDLRLGRGKVEWCKGKNQVRQWHSSELDRTARIFFEEVAAKKVAKKSGEERYQEG